MGLYEKKKTRFVTVTGGAFNVSRGKDQGYDTGHYFRGWLRGIRVQDKTYNGETISFAVLEFEDEYAAYDISIPLRSNLFTSVLRSIRVAESFRDQLDLHASGKESEGRRYTNIWVNQNGRDLRWDHNDGFPPVEAAEMGGQRVTSTARREAWVSAEIAKINDRIRAEDERGMTEDGPGPDYGVAAPGNGGYSPDFQEPDDQDGFAPAKSEAPADDDLPEAAATAPAAPAYDGDDSFINAYEL